MRTTRMPPCGAPGSAGRRARGHELHCCGRWACVGECCCPLTLLLAAMQGGRLRPRPARTPGRATNRWPDAPASAKETGTMSQRRCPVGGGRGLSCRRILVRSGGALLRNLAQGWVAHAQARKSAKGSKHGCTKLLKKRSKMNIAPPPQVARISRNRGGFDRCRANFGRCRAICWPKFAKVDPCFCTKLAGVLDSCWSIPGGC